MTLEPTKEQLEAITTAIFKPHHEGWPTNQSARRAWSFIRDMVLEAAAAKCDAEVGHYAAEGWDWACSELGSAIRAMKGTP